jgi:hypothetical protein
MIERNHLSIKTYTNREETKDVWQRVQMLRKKQKRNR